MHENQQPQTEAFELSAAEREAIEHEMHHYEDPRAASIEALKIVQKQRGWVPDGAIHAIADATYNGISPMIWTPRLFAYCFSCIHCLKNSYWQNLQNMMSLCNIS